MITRHMRTHARYEQNGQPPRKAMKVKAEKVKAENKVDEATKLIVNSNMNNNDLSMFNQNSLENINELRMKLQENLLANMPADISNLKREIKIEF
jgi:NADPH-dependent 7-cyano-7-deazaguanine reductase QueF-like protein